MCFICGIVGRFNFKRFFTKMKKIILSAMILAFVASCNKVGTGQGEEYQEILLSSGVSSGVKASYDGASALRGLQLLRSDVNSGDVPNFADQGIIESSRVGDELGSITFEIPQFYSKDGRSSYFAGYFPAAATIIDNVATWDIDAKKDIMTAAAVNAGKWGSSEQASLAFKHELAQIEIVFRAEKDKHDQVKQRWGTINSVKLLNTSAQLTYSYITQSTSKAGDLVSIPFCSADYTTDFSPMDLPDFSSDKVSAAGMFYPEQSSTITLEIETQNMGTKVHTVNLASGTALLKANRYQIALTFIDSSQGQIVEVCSTVEAWADGTSGGVDLDFD